MVGAGDRSRTITLVERAVRQANCLISFGLAGGLAPELRTGGVIVSTNVIAADKRWWAQKQFRDHIADFAHSIGALEGPVLGAPAILATAAQKSRAWNETRRARGRSRKRHRRPDRHFGGYAVRCLALNRRRGLSRAAAGGADPAFGRRNAEARAGTRIGAAPAATAREPGWVGARDSDGAVGPSRTRPRFTRVPGCWLAAPSPPRHGGRAHIRPGAAGRAEFPAPYRPRCARRAAPLPPPLADAAPYP